MQVLFGGTFDPVHKGHIALCKLLSNYFPSSTIRVIPNAQPPHRKAKVAAGDRWAMLAIATRNIDRIQLDDAEIKRDAPSYTIDTLRRFRNDFGFAESIVFVLGSDVVENIATWYQSDQIADLCHLCVLDRNGKRNLLPKLLDHMVTAKTLKDFETSPSGSIIQVKIPAIPISSTQIRYELELNGHSSFITPEVMTYIQKNQLYQGHCR